MPAFADDETVSAGATTGCAARDSNPEPSDQESRARSSALSPDVPFRAQEWVHNAPLSCRVGPRPDLWRSTALARDDQHKPLCSTRAGVNKESGPGRCANTDRGLDQSPTRVETTVENRIQHQDWCDNHQFHEDGSSWYCSRVLYQAEHLGGVLVEVTRVPRDTRR